MIKHWEINGCFLRSISSESIIICAAGSLVREDGVAVREWCNLLLIPLILESLLIIGSSFHHLANPEPCHSALQGSWGAGRKGDGGGGRQASSGVNRTHTSAPYVFIQVNKRKKEIKRTERRSENGFPLLKVILAHCVIFQSQVKSSNHDLCISP